MGSASFDYHSYEIKRDLHRAVIEALPDIERAHTYASENADIYRAFDRGQGDMRARSVSSLSRLFGQEEK